MRKPTEKEIEAAAAALANERFMRNGSPPITNVMDMLPEKLRAEVRSDAKAAMEAACASMNRQERPMVVCLSGSTRFIEKMAIAAWEFEKCGVIALGCHLLPASYGAMPDHQGEREGVARILDALHLRKIDLADRLHVMNVDGYIGESTRREIEYATQLGKPVTYYEPVGVSAIHECPKCGEDMESIEPEPDVGISGGWVCNCGHTERSEDDGEPVPEVAP